MRERHAFAKWLTAVLTLGAAALAWAPAVPALAGVDTNFSCYQCHSKKEITPWIAETWLESAHARAGVKCPSCHGNHDAGFDSPQFIAHPGEDKCMTCHPIRVKESLAGKHAGKVKCTACHPWHTFSLAVARDPEICRTCHDSEHAKSYFLSKMYVVYKVMGPKYSATCQRCHMPDGDHNVSDTVSSKELMLKVCNRCHSASFAGSVLAKGRLKTHW
ncbi:MAG: cytochrome c3 family protein [Nitrospirota bacterium]